MTRNFENRVRFNWGYHDAANAVKNGWATTQRNFGFCNYGSLAGLKDIADILTRHHDKAYAQGWQAGYYDAEDGMYEERGCLSDAAWDAAIKMGLVQE